jgi:hypothetical protein
VLASVAERWSDIRRHLDDKQFSALTGLVRRFTTARTEISRRVARQQLMDFLTASLPREHEVRAVIRNVALRSGSATLDLAAAVEQLERRLARTSSEDRAFAIADAKRALLAEPAYSEAQLRTAGGDPGRAGLLRLPGPDGSQRLPRFQFGPGGVPHPVVLTINLMLHADRDPWGVADWWLRENAWLDAIPASLVAHVPDEELIAIARAVREES